MDRFDAEHPSVVSVRPVPWPKPRRKCGGSSQISCRSGGFLPDTRYPRSRRQCFSSPYRDQGRIWITFSRTNHRGRSTRAYSTTNIAVARLASSRGAPPLAQVWLVHSGDASRISISPVSLFSESKQTSSRRLVMTRASGKLAANVSVAVEHMSTPATTSTPAARAPALLPPAPLKMSSPLIIPLLPPVRTVSGGTGDRCRAEPRPTRHTLPDTA